MSQELIDLLLADRETYAEKPRRLARIDAQLEGLGYVVEADQEEE